MKKAMVLMGIVALGFVFAGQGYAECIQTFAGEVRIHYEYKEKNNNNRRREFVVVDVYNVEGRYGGGCNTAVQRQKARERAREEIKRIVNSKYKGKAQAQMAALCQYVPNDIKTNAEWFKIDYLNLKLFEGWINPNNFRNLSISPNRLNQEVRIQKASGAGFACNGSTPVTPSPPTTTSTPNEVNFNRAGADYRNFEISRADCNECKDACNRDPGCKAWTYVKPGVQGPKAKCWLKNRVPSKVRDTCCTSGVK